MSTKEQFQWTPLVYTWPREAERNGAGSVREGSCGWPALGLDLRGVYIHERICMSGYCEIAQALRYCEICLAGTAKLLTDADRGKERSSI